MERLLQMQTVLAGGEPAATTDSPTGATDAPQAEPEPGEETPPEGGTPSEAGEGSVDAGQNDLSQGTEGTETTDMETAETAVLPAELAGLPEDVREQLLDIAREIAEGSTNFGELKRGHKLIAKHAEEMERLQGEVEGLRTQLAEASTAAAGDGRTPFKSVKEVKERELRLRKLIDWCDDNPEGGEQNGQEFSAEDVKAARRAARDELNYQLPEIREQLQAHEQRQAQFSQAQSAAKANVLKTFPELKDSENPEAQAVGNILSKQPWMKSAFVSPEIAALTWHLGEQALRERAKKRGIAFGANGLPAKAGVPGAARTPAKAGTPNRPAVRTGRPASGGTAAGARPGGATSVAGAKERIEKEHSVAALAALYQAVEP